MKYKATVWRSDVLCIACSRVDEEESHNFRIATLLRPGARRFAPEQVFIPRIYVKRWHVGQLGDRTGLSAAQHGQLLFPPKTFAGFWREIRWSRRCQRLVRYTRCHKQSFEHSDGCGMLGVRRGERDCKIRAWARREGSWVLRRRHKEFRAAAFPQLFVRYWLLTVSRARWLTDA